MIAAFTKVSSALLSLCRSLSQLRTTDFLKSVPVMAALSDGFQNTFIANVLERKPQVETLELFNQWVACVRKQMVTVKARKNCPLEYAGFFIDSQGIVLITQFSRKLQICNAKATVRLLLNFMGDQMQAQAMSNMRQLDELDCRRISAWLTPTSLYVDAPVFKPAKPDEFYVPEKVANFTFLKEPSNLPRITKHDMQRMSHLINFGIGARIDQMARCTPMLGHKRQRPDDLSDSDDPPPKRFSTQQLRDYLNVWDEEDAALISPQRTQPRTQLRITNENDVCTIESVGCTLAAIEDGVPASSAPDNVVYKSVKLRDIAGMPSDQALENPQLLWMFRTIREATIVVVEVGNRPVLNYVKCLHENRRIMLLMHVVREKYKNKTEDQHFNMVIVMREAAGLAKAGAIPSHTGGHQATKSDFVKRCAAALKELEPTAECDLTKLGANHQKQIRCILGGNAEPYEGCFVVECLNKEPKWTEKFYDGASFPLLRCGYCNTAKGYGRTWATEPCQSVTNGLHRSWLNDLEMARSVLSGTYVQIDCQLDDNTYGDTGN